MVLVPVAAGLALLACLQAPSGLALLVAGTGLVCAAAGCAWLGLALRRLAAARARELALLEQARAELAQARAEAEAARRAGSGLLASMGHELRTPMNAILGFAELLAQGGGRSEGERAHCLQTIHHSGSQLLALVDELVEWSRLELGQLKLEQGPCAPHAVVQEALREIAPQARAKGIALALRQRTPLPERVVSDPRRLRQVVVQLVRHALLFSDRNGIEVVLACHGTSYAVEVKDSADGVEPAQLESLFDPCATTPAALARRGGGIGLALALCRRLARALGGDLFATSEPGTGTTMHFTFPTGTLAGVPLRDVLPLEARGARGQAPGHARWRFPAARALVVNDGAENRELLALVLAEQGLRVDAACNGKEALEKLAASRYDLVLMDLQMPVMDGLAATRELRRRGHAMPVVALSAQAAAAFGPEALRAGCTGHIGKPIDIEVLLAHVAQLLGAQPLEAAPAEVLPLQPAAAGEAPVRSRYAGDARLVPIVRKFAARLDYQLELARSALQARDLPELARLAHWLAGSAGTVGYDAFTEPARELEAAALVGDAAGVERLLQRVTRMAERLQLPDLAPH